MASYADSNHRHQAVSFSLAIRSPRAKRSRLLRPPTPSPACEESVHYPVFNPQDPRHNPSLRPSPWLQDDYYLHQTQSHTGSVRWMQSLPRRSLRRARSGLLALRSGIYRRPSVPQSSSGNDEIPRMWSSSDSTEGSSDNHDALFSSAVSEASTEEDVEFGTDLYRTGCKNPSDVADGVKRYSSNFPSPTTCPGSDEFPGSVIGVYDVPGVYFAQVTSNPHQGPDSQPVEEKPTMCIDTPSSLDDDLERTTPTQFENIDPPYPDFPSTTSCGIGTPRVSPVLDEESDLPDIPDALVSQIITDTIDPNTITWTTPSGVSHRSRGASVSLAATENSKEAKAEQRICSCELGTTENTGTPEHNTEPSFGVRDAGTNGHSDRESEFDLGEADYYLSLAQYNDNDAVNDSSSIQEPPLSNGLSEVGTGIEPLSIGPWLPIEKDDLSSLSSWRDEYFLVDGKSNDLHPDRGDNPTKGDRIIGDGGIYSGPGLDRGISIGRHDIPEIVGPVRPVRVQPSRSIPTEREGSDSSDEYLATYSLFQRHYFS